MNIAAIVTGVSALKPLDHEEILGVLESGATDGEYNGELLHLNLTAKASPNSDDPYVVRGFQTLKISIDEERGNSFIAVTKDVNGNPSGEINALFVKTRMGVWECSIPDTLYNRRKVAGSIACGDRANIKINKLTSKEATEYIEKISRESAAREEHSKEYGVHAATYEAHSENPKLVAKLEADYGETFDRTIEYRTEFGSQIEKKAIQHTRKALRATKTLEELQNKYPLPTAKEEAQDAPTPQPSDEPADSNDNVASPAPAPVPQGAEVSVASPTPVPSVQSAEDLTTDYNELKAMARAIDPSLSARASKETYVAVILKDREAKK